MQPIAGEVSDTQLIHEWLLTHLAKYGPDKEFITHDIAVALDIVITSVSPVIHTFLKQNLVLQVKDPENIQNPKIYSRQKGPGFNAYVYTVNPSITKIRMNFNCKPVFTKREAVARTVTRREMLKGGDTIVFKVEHVVAHTINIAHRQAVIKEMQLQIAIEQEKLEAEMRQLTDMVGSFEVDLFKIPNKRLVEHLVKRRKAHLVNDKDFHNLYHEETT